MGDLDVTDVILFLFAAGLVVPLAKRFHISPIIAFLAAGLALGPFGLVQLTGGQPWTEYLFFEDVDSVRAIAELGVILLLFMIGLELSLERLWNMRQWVFGMGSTQIGLSALAIGLIAWFWGNSAEVSILLGASLALSSTAIVVQLLIEQKRFGTRTGQGTFSILLAQDLAVVPILFLVGAVGAQGEGSLWQDLGLALAEAIAAIGFILIVGRYVVRPVFRSVARLEAPELFMAVTLLIITSTAWATHAAGLSAALGAFLAGLILAESEYRHEVEVNIEPFKGLLLGLFFMSVGMGIDLGAVADNMAMVAAAVVGLLVIKAICATFAARLFGFQLREAADIGIGLCQGGEFAFIVIGLALSFSLLPNEVGQFMLVVAGASMCLFPLISAGARLILDRPGESSANLGDGVGQHVVIVGYGRIGQMTSQLLDGEQIPWIALDLDSSRTAIHPNVIIADARREATLSRVHLREASAMLICTDDPGATEAILSSADRYAPNVPKVVRARDEEHGIALMGYGATDVVAELTTSGAQLTEVTLRALGYPHSAARELTDRVLSEPTPS